MPFLKREISNKTRTLVLALATLFALICDVRGERSTTMLPGTVKNFELPNFNDATGNKEWELFGDSAEYISDSRVDVVNMLLRLFDGSASQSVKAEISSPSSEVDPSTNIVASPGPLLVESRDFTLKGKNWKWDGNKKFVEIFSGVDIDFKGGTKARGDEDGAPPTKITSDYASLDHSGDANIFFLKGNSSVKNSEMEVSCDTIKLEAGRGGKAADNVSDIKASGNVKMLHQKKEIKADDALIAPSKGSATLTGDPQITDLPSGAKLSGHTILLKRGEKSVEALSDKSRKERANAEFLHVQNNGKKQKINISADSIEMKSGSGESEFVFNGDVKVSSEDFRADCQSLSAMLTNAGESSKNSNPEIRRIHGSGSVVLSNESGVARAKEMDIIPSKSEILLSGNAQLDDPDRGIKLRSPVIIFMRQQNRGLAISNPKDKNSFVELEISGSPDPLAAASNQKNSKSSKSFVKSRRLSFERNGEKLVFNFERDVSIKSDSSDAECENMEVLAISNSKGGADIRKITARNAVKVSQKDYSANAEIANIYPKLDVEDKNRKKRTHKFVELLTAPDNPLLRPSVTLPSVGNLGLSDPSYAKKLQAKPTVIKSDKQWLTSSENADRYFFEGDVSVSGTDMNASCDKIEVVMKSPDKSSPKEITQIIMRGSVKLSQGLKDATCGRADIHVKEEMVVLSENPVVTNREDNSRASGPRMVYNRGNKAVTIEADESGGEADESQTPQRPTLVLPFQDK